MIQWVSFLMEPFEYAFMQYALVAVVLASINCALVGSFIVLRRMSFMGEALSHTILPGVVFAYVRGVQLFWGALGASLITAMGVGFLATRRNVREDTAIGVVLSGMFALGVMMMSSVQSYRDFGHMLFGSILAVQPDDLVLIAGVTLILLFCITLLFKELELNAFDTDYAKFIGANPTFVRFLLLILTALSVVSAVEVVGALLATALVIIPAATAALFARTLFRVIVFSSLLSILSGVIGLYLSYYYQFASGASIVVVAFCLFVTIWLFHFFKEYLRGRIK